MGKEDIEALAKSAAASDSICSPPTSMAASWRRTRSPGDRRPFQGRNKRRRKESDRPNSRSRRTGGRWRRFISGGDGAADGEIRQPWPPDSLQLLELLCGVVWWGRESSVRLHPGPHLSGHALDPTRLLEV
jgi:hypothetical protein